MYFKISYLILFLSFQKCPRWIAVPPKIILHGHWALFTCQAYLSVTEVKNEWIYTSIPP